MYYKSLVCDFVFQLRERDLNDNLAMKNKQMEIEDINGKIDNLKKKWQNLEFENIRAEKNKLLDNEEKLRAQV